MIPENLDVVMAAGSVLGGAGTSGIALTNGIVLLAGLRGSDRVKLNRDKAGLFGIALGTLSSTADTVLTQFSHGVAEVPTALIQGGAFGNVGMGGVALSLTATIFLFKWKKLVVPALLGTGAGVIYAQAGGIWSVGQNMLLMAVNSLGAL
ncbi:hypothetical protein [Streptomyces racemochromogenes]|uniref:hypothetical protein n=1 Tax=Streptomyces racemochromogenes TaxID=67353 RepID=UPI0035EA4EE4